MLNPNEPNSALTYYVHYGSKIDRRLRVTAALLTQILSEPAFNILRTKEQLGYIVSADAWSAPGDNDAGLRIVVQSERGPVYLEERVEAFLDHMKGVIELMTDEEFAEQKNGLERKWREVVKNLDEEVSRFWAHIDSGYLDFLRRRPSPLSHSLPGLTQAAYRHRRRNVFEDDQQARRTVFVSQSCPPILQDSIQAFDPCPVTEATAETHQPYRRSRFRTGRAGKRYSSRRSRLELFSVCRWRADGGPILSILEERTRGCSRRDVGQGFRGTASPVGALPCGKGCARFADEGRDTH